MSHYKARLFDTERDMIGDFPGPTNALVTYPEYISATEDLTTLVGHEGVRDKPRLKDPFTRLFKAVGWCDHGTLRFRELYVDEVPVGVPEAPVEAPVDVPQSAQVPLGSTIDIETVPDMGSGTNEAPAGA